MNCISRDNASRRIGRELLAGLVVVFLLFGPYLAKFVRVSPQSGNVLRGSYALWFLWQPHDIFILLGCMLGLALMAVLLRESLRRWAGQFPLRLFDHLFVVALGAGVLTNLWFHTQRSTGYHIGQFGMEIRTAWLALVAIAAYSLASSRSRLVSHCACLCRIMSPALLIVAYQLVRMPTLAQPMDPLAPTPNEAGVHITHASLTGNTDAADRPVYLFIFDEWSYSRTFESGRLRGEFMNLAELAQTSIVFHQAHSPAGDTMTSIPAILRGTPDSSDLVDGKRPGFLSNGQFTACRQFPSIFTTAGCRDYRKIMVQWGFATSLWVADELDVCRAYPWFHRGQSALGTAAVHLYNAAFFWTDPWSTLAHDKVRAEVEDGHKLELYRQMRHDVFEIIRQPGRTFAIMHLPFPHPPYLLNADGSYRGSHEGSHMRNDVDGYRRNLAYVDSFIGEIVRELKAAGRFDQSLLIITSDHSWRGDPAEPAADHETLTHVPLMVKLPGQIEPLTMGSDFRSYRLGELIGRALREPGPPEKLVRWLNASPPESQPSVRAGICDARAAVQILP